MITRRGLIGTGAMLGIAALQGKIAMDVLAKEAFPVTRSDAEWRAQLSPEQYNVLRRHGTERAGTSPLNREKRKGTFLCAGCDQDLFSSDTKFESGTGWPSFYQPLANAVETTTDRSFFMTRTEAHCARCGGHLGHVFEDGPKPTGLRYCLFQRLGHRPRRFV
jgi:peptide-methionine (R)-S-oxide reductase